MPDAKSQVCEFLSYFAARTWHDLMCVHRGAYKLDEVTITQNLVREFLIHSKMLSLPISIFESANESANGNDLEILVETQKGFVLIPSQVKVLKQNYKYSTISHSVRETQQIDLLLDYALKEGGIPAYIFFNHCNDFEFHKYVEIELPLLTVGQFGCTIGNAFSIRDYFFERNGIRKWKVPSFADIHLPSRFAIPFVTGFDRLILGTLQDIKWFIGKPNIHKVTKLRFWSENDISSDKNWIELIPPPRISGISPDLPEMGDIVVEAERPQHIFRRSFNIPQRGFSPKYRIVILSHPRSGIWDIS